MLAFNTEAGKLTGALNVKIKYFIMSFSGTSIYTDYVHYRVCVYRSTNNYAADHMTGLPRLKNGTSINYLL